MKELKLIRKTISANATEHFEFDVDGFEYLVVNNNDFDIYVAFKNTNNTDEMMIVPAQSSRVCLINKDANLSDTSKQLFTSKDVYVYAESAGEVEVQCIRF